MFSEVKHKILSVLIIGNTHFEVLSKMLSPKNAILLISRPILQIKIVLMIIIC